MSIVQTTHQTPAGPIGVPVIPPLEQGDHLTREEFHRRYDAMPHIKKAELIEGVVYLSGNEASENHGKQQFHATGWLGQYVAFTPGTKGGVHSSVLLDRRNEPQPDAFLMIAPECGGQVQIDTEGYIIGAPELINETSASSASYDLHSKLEAYRRNRVQE